jgi:DNA repair protein RecN (Recombination protein N)
VSGSVLRELRIRDYAIIGQLELELPAGLVAFTGETGAGKSIIVGALGLALGWRAHPDQLRTGAEEAVVEARFAGPLRTAVLRKMETAGLRTGNELLLRRVVPRSGRSRAYVNDTAVSLGTLEGLGRELVDIHGQHHHQSLLHRENHLDFLDGFGKLLELRSSCREAYQRHLELRREQDELTRREKEKAQRLDYLRYQVEEIERARLRPGEEEELRAQSEILKNSQRLAAAAQEAEELLYSGEAPAAGTVDLASRRLEEIAGIDPGLRPLVGLLRECQLQLEESGREVQAYRSRLESDPERLAEVEDRLAEIARLRKKSGDTVAGILENLEKIKGEISLLIAGEERLAEIEKELAVAVTDLSRLAADLSRGRKASRGKLEKKILAELKLLHLAGSRFQIALTRLEDPEGPVLMEGRRYRIEEKGLEEAEFFLSTNPGEEPKPLSHVASGGELSRVMLAIKNVLAEVDQVPSLVFDEVDIGIGGKVARVVGDRLKKISAGRQVFCITHLPQIASLADAHYNIRKSTSEGRTSVSVTWLSRPQRVEEVARMMSSRQVTAATRRHAAEMLQERR